MTLSWAGQEPSPLASPGWKNISHSLLKTSFPQEEETQAAYGRAQFSPALSEDVDAKCSSSFPDPDALSRGQALDNNPSQT